MFGDGSFILREFDPGRKNIKQKEESILLGQVQDLDLAEMNRLLTTIRPCLELTTGLSQLFTSSRSYNKSFSIAEEYWKGVLGEVSFKRVTAAPSYMYFRLLMLCAIGVIIAAGTTGLLTRHPAKATEIGVYTSLLLTAFMLAIGTLWRADRVEALLGSEGVGVQNARGIRRALPYRLLGDLTYTVTESKGKTLAPISSNKEPEEYSAVVIIESDEHLAQLEKVVRDAQPKLGTPTAKEKR